MSVENISQTVSDLFEDYAKANGWGATKGKLSQSKIDFFSGAAAAFVVYAHQAPMHDQYRTLRPKFY